MFVNLRRYCRTGCSEKLSSKLVHIFSKYWWILF